MKTRFFERFDLARYICGDGEGNARLRPSRDVIKYLEALNNTILERSNESLTDKEIMSLEELFSRTWGRYVAPCVDWAAGRLIEMVKQVKPEGSNLPKRPNRNIIAVMDYPAEQPMKNRDINAVMMALVKREPTCPMIGTNAEVHYLESYTAEPKLVLSYDRTSSSAYRAPEDSAKIWQEAVDVIYPAILRDAEPSMLGDKAGELSISICGTSESADVIIKAFENAKNKFTHPEYREKVRIFRRD
ncbi:hypothetical protein IJH02_03065 [Candidatus Saccharibacteria bacterium]|nr:hypothetical protein [Candidatus Saccharibacteria bacterium]